MTDGLSREERTPSIRLFQSAALGATGLVPPTPVWFLLPTLTLCDTTLCDRSATRAQEPGPLFLSCKGQCSVGPATEHRCAHLPREGWRALQQCSPVCDKLPQQSEKSRESDWDIALCLGLFFFPFILLFLLLGPDRKLGCRPGFGIFPRAEGFSHWCVQWGSSCVCTHCFSEAMNQQFNYALFRKFPHHIAPGKVFPLFYIYISKTYIFHLNSPTIFSF